MRPKLKLNIPRPYYISLLPRKEPALGFYIWQLGWITQLLVFRLIPTRVIDRTAKTHWMSFLYPLLDQLNMPVRDIVHSDPRYPVSYPPESTHRTWEQPELSELRGFRAPNLFIPRIASEALMENAIVTRRAKRDSLAFCLTDCSPSQLAW